MVFVDDSHATGFIGQTGRGTHEHFGVLGKIDVITTTLGKALGGASGGCVSGPTRTGRRCAGSARGRISSRTRSRRSSSPAPSRCSRSHRQTTERRDKLEWNTKYWRGLLTEAGFDVKAGESPIVPVMLYNAKLAQDVARDLFDEGDLRRRLLLPGRDHGSGAHSNAALRGAREASSGQGDRRVHQGREEVRHPRQEEEGESSSPEDVGGRVVGEGDRRATGRHRERDVGAVPDAADPVVHVPALVVATLHS